MLQIIIFSYNRALQLDTLITSFIEKWQAPQYYVDIIYNSSDKDFQKAYDVLIEKYRNIPNIVFNKEKNVKDKYSVKELLNIRNFIAYIKNKRKFTPKSNFRSLCIEILKKNKNDFVMFLTDDSMFIENVNIETEIFNWIKEYPNKRQFSLRMGVGINNKGNNVKEKCKYIFWEFHQNPRNTNWGYPFSVDAHIYHKKPIMKLFSKYIFCNPNTLEGFINAQVYRKQIFEEGKANIKCSLLSYPINMVQTIEKNETLGIDCKILNKMFLNGYTMRYPIPDKNDTFQQYPKHLYFKKDDEVKKVLIQDKLDWIFLNV